MNWFVAKSLGFFATKTFVAKNKNINISTLSATNPSSSLKAANSDEFELLTKGLILIQTQAPSGKCWCQTKFSYSDELVRH